MAGRPPLRSLLPSRTPPALPCLVEGLFFLAFSDAGHGLPPSEILPLLPVCLPVPVMTHAVGFFSTLYPKSSTSSVCNIFPLSPGRLGCFFLLSGKSHNGDQSKPPFFSPDPGLKLLTGGTVLGPPASSPGIFLWLSGRVAVRPFSRRRMCFEGRVTLRPCPPLATGRLVLCVITDFTSPFARCGPPVFSHNWPGRSFFTPVVLFLCGPTSLCSAHRPSGAGLVVIVLSLEVIVPCGRPTPRCVCAPVLPLFLSDFKFFFFLFNRVCGPSSTTGLSRAFPRGRFPTRDGSYIPLPHDESHWMNPPII